MSTEATVQLPADAPANKNLLRFTSVAEGGNTVLQEVLALADADGNIVGVLHSDLRTADEETRSLLREVVERLDVLLDVLTRGG